MNLHHTLSARFLSHLLATPAGRAHVLAQLAEAEDSGEARIFDQALSRVDDPQLARMIKRHQADEIRHAELFRGCIARTGVDPGPVPAHLRVMDRLDTALGGFLGRPITDHRGVMEAYILLQVVEERAVDQFGLMARVFRHAGDTESADVLDGVARDEARHLRYCHAIARRYAPSDDVRRATIARFREIEARAFSDNGLANLRHALDRGLVTGARTVWTWRAIAWVNGTLRAAVPSSLPYTRFAHEPEPGAQPTDGATEAQPAAA